MTTKIVRNYYQLYVVYNDRPNKKWWVRQSYGSHARHVDLDSDFTAAKPYTVGDQDSMNDMRADVVELQKRIGDHGEIHCRKVTTVHEDQVADLGGL